MMEFTVGYEYVVGLSLLWTAILIKVRAGAHVKSPL
jgi:hypothetical protein